MSYFLAFFNLFYPRLCAGCDQALLKHEDTLCTLCLYQLSRTPFHTMENNVLVDNFYGRIPVKYATAWCYFKKGGKVQHLIHLIKYKGRKELGLYMGKLFGVDLLQSDYFKGIDVIVPVPLHPKKKHKRGYNQSEWIAMGLSETMNIPVDTKSLIKTTATQSQTKKNRKMRWLNVKEIFLMNDLKSLENKHVLLLDDVLTTGATMEACATELLKVKGITISVAALSCVE